MNSSRARQRSMVAALTLSLVAICPAYPLDGSDALSSPDRNAIERDLRADLTFLADDSLDGRGSATRDEHIAALFAASQMQSLGLEPGGDTHTFIQRSALPSPLPARIQQRLSTFENTPRTETWNAVGILRGTAPDSGSILLTAHLDHLGVGPARPGKARRRPDLQRCRR